jgi:hypothetical protein
MLKLERKEKKLSTFNGANRKANRIRRRSPEKLMVLLENRKMMD